MQNSTFDPNTYDVPAGPSGYMKLQPGENRFRFMTDPITGWEWWTDDKEKGRIPHRVHEEYEIDERVTDAKPFWAMVVYNPNAKQFQILEITQRGVMRGILALWRDSDWGDPKKYDIAITKRGEGKLTKYEVNPKPAKDLPEDVLQQWEDTHINLNALWHNKDPFNTDDMSLEEEFGGTPKKYPTKEDKLTKQVTDKIAKDEEEEVEINDLPF